MFNKTVKISLATIFLFSLAGCGENDNDNNNNNFSITGSVPGTLIEAFGENGSYYKSVSSDNGTDRHPFSIALKPGVAYYLFMTVNENSATESITTPIMFSNNGVQSYRFTAKSGATADLGYLPLHITRTAAGGDDADNDGVLDVHHKIATSELTLLSTPSTVTTWDHDNDGIHNQYDKDYTKSNDDSDGDGLPDHVDVNVNNDEDHSNRFDKRFDKDDDGYLDEDRDHDGYYDDDKDRDGYHDDDNDKDGYHDDDNDKDGYHDEDKDHDGVNDNDGSYSKVKSIITAINGALITVNVTRSEHSAIPLGSLVIDASNAYFEHTDLASLSVGNDIKIKGIYNATTKQLAAYKIEKKH
ncbi:hypothetical protein MS2017_1108 [Bathymodiolus thermophilus thioautotrophic gill symbiont]|uniref:DUF5666 domain-containing protein n=1 Tax=Bathymodiolus thermophilus thioautotrophic gill symbiont TaxID=2360 RepID=A0A3G3IMV1_9GAMM|nr:hypothetical protein [Bathymodiolus thermophilus thioautotrophic gill symbiont]AYQ56812.1 hypothetical protein MS2017_1108 [Bathymodiolus thermophilus thioautotrophic gill symbiont]